MLPEVELLEDHREEEGEEVESTGKAGNFPKTGGRQGQEGPERGWPGKLGCLVTGNENWGSHYSLLEKIYHKDKEGSFSVQRPFTLIS